MMKGRPSYAYSEKLMKQMGWTEGKGLGKNEDGMPDFIRPKKKVNTKGIGFNGVDDRWIEHQEAFDSLLSNLNNGNPAAKEEKLIGVEERAFKLGGRVHYSKFLRGKDLSQKKKEDLNAIVVKRKKYDAENVQEADATSQEDLSGLKTYTSSMSYQEYFAQRMKASRRHKGLNEDGDLQSYEQTEETRGEDSEITSKRKHKRYEKDEKLQDEWTSHVDEEVVGAGLALNRADTEDAYSVYNENVQAKKKKKKKKSKHKSYDGGDSQWSETITEQREDRLSGDSVPEECSLGECVSKRKRKLKHADDSEQTFHEATMSQMGFHSKYSVPDRVKKKSKHDSHIGTGNQWTETIISPVECYVEEHVPKRLKKSKHTVENSVENSEQLLPKTAASQMEFCSEDSVPRVKKKSKHKPDRDTTGQKFETNDEQWDDGNRSSLALAETLTSSTKHIVHKSEEAAPKRTKKLKRQPRSSTDDTADGSLQALTEIVPTTEFSSEEHQQQVKKSKHRPARGTVEEDQPEIISKKAAVASLADRAAKEKVPMLPLQTFFEEEMPKRATKRPKQKAPEVADETSRLKIQTESVKARARKESNQQQEGVMAKKRKQEPEQNEVPEDKTKKISKQHQTGGLTPKEPDPEQERNEAKAQFKTDANENSKQKLMPGKTSLKQEKAAQTASKLVAKKSEKATTKLVARKPMHAGGKVVSKKLVQLRQNVEYEYGRATRPAAYNAYRPTMRPEASTRRARHPTSLSGQRGSVKHSAGNGVDSRYRRYDAGKAARDFIASRKKIAIRNSRVGNAARKHQRKAEPPRAWRLDIIQKGMWRPLFKPDVKVQPVDDDTAATMAQWVVDTVEGLDSRVTPAKACHLDKETFAMALADHIYMQHNASNWMHIPGYGSKSWVEGCVNLLFARMLARNQNQASESFVQSTANSEKKASGGSTAGSRMRK